MTICFTSNRKLRQGGTGELREFWGETHHRNPSIWILKDWLQVHLLVSSNARWWQSWQPWFLGKALFLPMMCCNWKAEQNYLSTVWRTALSWSKISYWALAPDGGNCAQNWVSLRIRGPSSPFLNSAVLPDLNENSSAASPSPRSSK